MLDILAHGIQDLGPGDAPSRTRAAAVRPCSVPESHDAGGRGHAVACWYL